MDGFIQLITVIIIFGIVLAATYFVTVWIGNYQKARNRGMNIELLEAVRLTPSQHIQIVRICDGYYALAVSKDSVTLICTLTEEEAATLSTDGGPAVSFDGAGSFRAVLDKAFKRSEKDGKK